MGDDLKTVEKWAAIFLDPEALGEAVAYNAIEKRAELKADISLMSLDMGDSNHFQSGKDLADIAVLLIGDAPTEVPEVEDYSVDVDLHMVNHILAGFIYGMTTDNHLTEIEACYQGGAEMDHELTKAVQDFKAGGWNYITQGVLQLLLVGFQIPQELHACENMQDDLSAIESWASIFTEKTELISTVTKHFLLHKKQVTADIGTLKTDFSTQEYFKTGEDLATLAEVLIGPMH